MYIDKAIAEANRVEEFLDFAKKTSSHVSILGCRYITVEGYDGFLYLNDLPNRVHELINKKIIKFSQKERKIGNELNEIYHQVLLCNYFQLEFCNLITYILAAIRNVYSKTENKYEWSENHRFNAFKYYTRQQYIDTFGFVPVTKYEDQKNWLAPTREEIRAQQFLLMRWMY